MRTTTQTTPQGLMGRAGAKPSGTAFKTYDPVDIHEEPIMAKTTRKAHPGGPNAPTAKTIELCRAYLAAGEAENEADELRDQAERRHDEAQERWQEARVAFAKHLYEELQIRPSDGPHQWGVIIDDRFYVVELLPCTAGLKDAYPRTVDEYFILRAPTE